MNNENRIDVITYFGAITETMVGQLIDISLQAKAASSSEIRLYISSTGGNLHAGFAAYHHLRSIGVPLVTHNIGNVESSAVLLFLAAETRLAAPHATFLLHDFNWTFSAGTVAFGTLREYTQSLEFDSERYAQIFDERTKKGFDIRGCLRGDATRLDAASAESIGVVTAVVAHELPIGAVLWWITPNTAAVSYAAAAASYTAH